jgi:hypothetical protein
VGNLQLDATVGNHRPVLAPVKLEGFPGLEAQGHENTPARCLACLVLFVFPLPDESSHPSIGSIITQRHKVFIQPSRRAPVLAGSGGFQNQPSSQFVSKRVQSAGTFGSLEPRFNALCP